MEQSIICFHNPNEPNGFLSNWYLSEFELNSITFSSIEQYMMYRKAILFDDIDAAKKILVTSDVAEIKSLGRAVHNYNDLIWNGVRQVAVYNGLFSKFSQNKELKDKLLATNQSILAECAVKDKIWGIGLSMSDPNRFNILQWKGQNLLGFALMEVRHQLSIASKEEI